MLELRVGQTLVDTYRIERLIAEGGMGSVYEATHMRVPKRFAIKFLNIQLVEKGEALVRFRREAEIIATLDHPNVVGLYDYNVTEDGVPYIVLEYLDGEHLGKRLDRGPMQLDEAVRVIVPVMHALAAAHKHGIIHRDLKPENIILCKGDVVKVVDFGIAKICGYDLTGVNSIIGTVPYMAPEQIGGGTLDGRADMFALASIFYEMLSGQMAFGGSQSVPEVAMRVMHHQPPFLTSVSLAVNQVIFKAMAKDPAGRYPDLESFLRALLEAASRPDEAPAETPSEEGLPPLAGEATAIMQRAPAAPAPAPYIAASSTERTVMARQDMPLVTPAMGGPSPVAGSASVEVTPAGDAPEGYAPLAEQATQITRLDDGGTDPARAPLAAQSTVITRMDEGGATDPSRAPVPPGPGPGLSEAAREPSGLVPYSMDAHRFHPLVTKAVPVVPMRPEDEEGTAAGAQKMGTDLAEESTAITRGAVKADAADAPAPQLRLLHSVATAQQPVADAPGANGAVESRSNDALLATAEVARPQLDLQAASRPTEMRPAISGERSEETGRALLPPPDLRPPGAAMGGTLKLVILGLGVAVVLILVGLIVRAVLAK